MPSAPFSLRRFAAFLLAGCLASVLVLSTSFPAAAASKKSGERVEITGQVQVLFVDDFDHGQAELRYLLEEEGSRRLHNLRFQRRPAKELRSGDRLTVRGRALGRDIEVEESVAALDPAQAATSAEVTATQGTTRRAVVFLVDLVGATASSRYSVNSVTGKMYTDANNVDELYLTASHGTLDFEPDGDGDGMADVFGPFKIAAQASVCDPYTWAYQTDDAATAAGINLSLYEHRIYVLPRYNEQACSWAGLGNVGSGVRDQYKSGFGRSWIAEGESGMVYAHEIGHNLGMAHASTDPGNDGVVDSEYGDNSDPMGLSRGWHLFNAPHAGQMNWFDPTDNRMVDVTASTTVSLLPLERDADSVAGPRTLRIHKEDSNDYYFISYRKALGEYNSLASTYQNRVNIHRYRGAGYSNTLFIASLADGESFTDQINGITITQLGAQADGSMAVGVSFGCLENPPLVSLSPALAYTRTSSTATFDVTVTNGDSGGCPEVDYRVRTLGLANLDLQTGRLAPGASWHSRFTVAGDQFQADQTSTVTVEASGGPTRTGEASVSLLVDDTPPSQPVITSVTLGRRNKATLSWSTSVDNQGGSGLELYRVYRNGALLATTTTTQYTDSAGTAGTVYTVSAVDRAGNPATSEAVTVGSTGSGNDGSGGDTKGGGRTKKTR